MAGSLKCEGSGCPRSAPFQEKADWGDEFSASVRQLNGLTASAFTAVMKRILVVHTVNSAMERRKSALESQLAATREALQRRGN
jgi:hypothetical protein